MPVYVTKWPTFLDKVNFIVYFLFVRCESPWIVFAKTGLRANANLVLGLVGTSWDDVWREMVRPKRMRFGRHGRAGNRNKRRSSIPQSEEVIARILNPDDIIRPNWQTDTELIWFLDSQVQKQLYKVLIINLITDYAYDWWSGILEDPRAHCDSGRQISRIQDYTIHWGTEPNGVNFGNPLVLEGDIFGSFGAFTLGPGKWQCLISAKVIMASVFEPFAEVACGFRFDSPGEPPEVYMGHHATLNFGDTVDISNSAVISGPTGCISMELTKYHSVIWTDAQFSCIQIADA